MKGGLEAAVHTTRRYFELNEDDHSKIAVKLDFKNAFNSVRRDTMLAIVAKVAPTIYDFCKNVCSIQPVLNFHSNEIRSATGMQQGDPLGSLSVISRYLRGGGGKFPPPPQNRKFPPRKKRNITM